MSKLSDMVDERGNEIRHRVDIYHRMASTGMYYAQCSCGTKSPEAPDGRTAWKWIREFHPEAYQAAEVPAKEGLPTTRTT